MIAFIILCAFCLAAVLITHKMPNPPKEVKVYCEVMCVQHTLFEYDVNVLVDFGIAEQGKNANGWIYNSENNKKYSFASPMSVIAYMAKRDWEYEDVIIVSEDKSCVWHFILAKDVPSNYTDEDIICDIDYRIM